MEESTGAGYLALLFLVLTSISRVLGATTYYVAPDGSDLGPGTLNEPFATVAHALSVASSPGDEVRLRQGVYQSTQNLGMGFPGTEQAPIVLGAYPGETAILDGSAMPETSAALQIAAPWIVVEGLEIRNGRRQGISIFGPGSILHDVVVRDNHIHDNHSSTRVTGNVFVQTGVESVTWIGDPTGGVTYDHNLWFGGSVHPAALGTGDVYQQPIFEEGPVLQPLSYRLTPESPGVGVGISTAEVVDDFLGEPRTAPFELGALEIESLFSDGFESGGVERWRE